MADQQQDNYRGPERRAIAHLSDDQINEIAQRAAAVAIEQVYTSIGRSVVQKFLWMVGAGSLAVVAWLTGAGHLKIGG